MTLTRPVTDSHTAPGTRRILHLRTVTGRGGGPEKTILNSPAFIGGGYEMRLVYFRPTDDSEFDMVERASKVNAQLVDIPEKGPWDVRAWFRLMRELRDFRPHVLHAHDYKTNVLSILFGRLFGVRRMTTLHGNVERTRRLDLYYQTDRWSLPRMDHVVVVSEDLLRHARELGVAEGKCSLVLNAIDHDKFRRVRSAAEARKRLGLDSEGPLIGSIGRLSAEKGFDYLIRAVQELRRTIPNAQLVIVGEGNQRETLETLVRELGLENVVHLVGHQADVVPWLESMDLFVSSSLREGLPNVLLEAMAMEVPVVATEVGGVSGLVLPKVTGLLVKPGDMGRLAIGARQMLKDKQLSCSVVLTARDLITEKFSFERRMLAIRSIYDRLIES